MESLPSAKSLAEPAAARDPVTYHWRPPPANPTLGAGAVHIWCIDLNRRSSAEYHELGILLSEDEWARARKFRLERDRRRYIVGRGLLRRLLGYYLDQAPERLRFQCQEWGKPTLEDDAGLETLHFNLSHSAGVALYALSRVGAVGVDIEHIAPFAELDDLAERHFSLQELVDLRSIAATDRCAAFYRCWTRKEAFVKAIGQGLSWPLKSFSVSLLPGEPALLYSVRGEPRAPAAWSLHDLEPAPGMAAAVAIEGRVSRVEEWYWDDDCTSLTTPSPLRSVYDHEI